MTQPLRLCVRRASLPGPEAPIARVTVQVPSAVDCIEEAVSVILRHCLAGAVAGPQVQFRLQVALSEALANAIVRGNREDASKRVVVQADLGPEVICLYVTDEGDGFDPRAVPDALSPEGLQQDGGRGLFLIHCMVDDVHFNAQGNSICMTLRRP
jgi:serine/threonine-protein kinase RsbW